jgi:hypothetical protein
MRIAVGWGLDDSLWGLEGREGDDGASGFDMLVHLLRRKKEKENILRKRGV